MNGRRVQVKRGEVWRTDEDGSWRVIGVLEDRSTSKEAAITEILAAVGADPSEYDGWTA